MISMKTAPELFLLIFVRFLGFRSTLKTLLKNSVLKANWQQKLFQLLLMLWNIGAVMIIIECGAYFSKNGNVYLVSSTASNLAEANKKKPRLYRNHIKSVKKLIFRNFCFPSIPISLF